MKEYQQNRQIETFQRRYSESRVSKTNQSQFYAKTKQLKIIWHEKKNNFKHRLYPVRNRDLFTYKQTYAASYGSLKLI
jgi:hypothetical protein